MWSWAYTFTKRKTKASKPITMRSFSYDNGAVFPLVISSAFLCKRSRYSNRTVLKLTKRFRKIYEANSKWRQGKNTAIHNIKWIPFKVVYMAFSGNKLATPMILNIEVCLVYCMLCFEFKFLTPVSVISSASSLCKGLQILMLYSKSAEGL